MKNVIAFIVGAVCLYVSLIIMSTPSYLRGVLCLLGCGGWGYNLISIVDSFKKK